METSGVNGPLAVATFIAGAGASLNGLLFSLAVAILVPIVGKFADGFIRAWIAERRNGWKQRFREAETQRKAAEERAREAEARIARLLNQNDG
jgi:hypothetical protein